MTGFGELCRDHVISLNQCSTWQSTKTPHREAVSSSADRRYGKWTMSSTDPWDFIQRGGSHTRSTYRALCLPGAEIRAGLMLAPPALPSFSDALPAAALTAVEGAFFFFSSASLRFFSLMSLRRQESVTSLELRQRVKMQGYELIPTIQSRV